MKEYSFFKTNYWSDENFRTMSPEHKVIMFFLLTSPLTNWCGIFKLEISMLSFYTGLREDAVENAFGAFLKQYPNLVAYDYETKEVAVLNWAKMNWLNSPPEKVIISAARGLEEVESEFLLKKMVEHTKSSKLKKPFLDAFRSLRIRRINEKRLMEALKTGEDVEFQENPIQVYNSLKTNILEAKGNSKSKSKSNNNPPTPPKGDGSSKKRKRRKEVTPTPEMFKGFDDPKEAETLWHEWAEFKKEQHNERYYSERGLKAAITKLRNLCGGNMEKAKAINEHAMAKSWKGHYPINESSKKRNGGTSELNAVRQINQSDYDEYTLFGQTA